MAGATLLVACATLVLAWFTRKALIEGKAAFDAAQTTAAAAKEEADATKALAEESRIDRELAWRPYLTIQEPGPAVAVDEWSDSATIVNVGTGPALECGYVVYRHDRWGF